MYMITAKSSEIALKVLIWMCRQPSNNLSWLGKWLLVALGVRWSHLRLANSILHGRVHLTEVGLEWGLIVSSDLILWGRILRVLILSLLLALGEEHGHQECLLQLELAEFLVQARVFLRLAHQ